MSANQHNTSNAARFLQCLDPTATSFSFQSFDDDKERGDELLARVLHGSLDQHAAELERLNARGAGVFVTINATDDKGRCANNIVRVRAVFADLDGAPLEPVLANGMQPHIVNESSPSHFHCYWRVAGLPLDQFWGVQKTIAARFDGDPIVCDLPRVMRLPGFMHGKGKPFVSRIVRTDPGCVTGTNIVEHFPPIPKAPRAPSPQGDAAPFDLWLVAGALKVIPNADVAWLRWATIGLATWRGTNGNDYGFQAFDQWSAKSSKYNKRFTEKTWGGFFKSPPNRIDAGTLIFLADEAKPGWRDRLMCELMDEVQS
jgi:Primase C terminal 2 (PriCT-2)/RepB DNA-primase from phage plasmid